MNVLHLVVDVFKRKMVLPMQIDKYDTTLYGSHSLHVAFRFPKNNCDYRHRKKFSVNNEKVHITRKIASFPTEMKRYCN